MKKQKSSFWQRTMMRLLIALLTVIQLPAMASNGNFGGGTGTTADPLLIDDAKDLVAFRDRVNNGELTLSAKLTADIDLSTVCSETLGSWTPIGLYKSGEDIDDYAYQGTFDGDGHKISSLYIRYAGKDGHQGLFGMITNATIINLEIEGHVTIDGYSYYTALFSGSSSYSTIKNCIARGSVDGYGYTSSFTGSSREGYVSNCINYADITGKSVMGSIVAGYGDMLTNCLNLGNLTKNDPGSNDFGYTFCHELKNGSNCLFYNTLNEGINKNTGDNMLYLAAESNGTDELSAADIAKWTTAVTLGVDNWGMVIGGTDPYPVPIITDANRICLYKINDMDSGGVYCYYGNLGTALKDFQDVKGNKLGTDAKIYSLTGQPVDLTTVITAANYTNYKEAVTSAEAPLQIIDDPNDHVTLTFKSASPKAGETISFTIATDEEWISEGVQVTDANGAAVEYTTSGYGADLTVSFTMPSTSVTITAQTITQHTITAETAVHGTFYASPAKAYKDVSITVNVTPDEGYYVKSATVTSGGEPVAFTGGTWYQPNLSFTMPNDDVSVSVVFATSSEVDKTMRLPILPSDNGTPSPFQAIIWVDTDRVPLTILNNTATDTDVSSTTYQGAAILFNGTGKYVHVTGTATSTVGGATIVLNDPNNSETVITKTLEANTELTIDEVLKSSSLGILATSTSGQLSINLKAELVDASDYVMYYYDPEDDYLREFEQESDGLFYYELTKSSDEDLEFMLTDADPESVDSYEEYLSTAWGLADDDADPVVEAGNEYTLAKGNGSTLTLKGEAGKYTLTLNKSTGKLTVAEYEAPGIYMITATDLSGANQAVSEKMLPVQGGYIYKKLLTVKADEPVAVMLSQVPLPGSTSTQEEMDAFASGLVGFVKMNTAPAEDSGSASGVATMLELSSQVPYKLSPVLATTNRGKMGVVATPGNYFLIVLPSQMMAVLMPVPETIISADGTMELSENTEYSEKSDDAEISGLLEILLQGETLNVNTDRKLKGGQWNTLCLPFTATRAQLGLADTDVVDYLSTTNYSDDGEKLYAHFVTMEATESLKAGVPYLVKPAQDIELTGIQSVTFSSELKPAMTDELVFMGTIRKCTPAAYYEDVRFLSGDGKSLLTPSAEGQKIKGFRAYFEIVNERNAKLLISFDDDETTGILSVKDGQLTVETTDDDAPRYNLQGQRVGKDYKGVVIKNGKKYLER